jgi:hypothetical protein
MMQPDEGFQLRKELFAEQNATLGRHTLISLG